MKHKLPLSFGISRHFINFPIILISLLMIFVSSYQSYYYAQEYGKIIDYFHYNREIKSFGELRSEFAEVETHYQNKSEEFPLHFE